MNFQKLKVYGEKEDFVQAAYIGPKVERWGISVKPVITKGEYGWSTHFAEGWISHAEIERALQSQRERLLDCEFLTERGTCSQGSFDTLGEAKKWFTLWWESKVASTFDVVFFKLGNELGAEFLSLRWNDVYGTQVDNLKGELSKRYAQGEESRWEFSRAAQKRHMEIAEMFDYSVPPELEERFSAASKPTGKTAELQDAMNFGDIQVGVNKIRPSGRGNSKRKSNSGCAEYVGGFIILLFLLVLLANC